MKPTAWTVVGLRSTVPRQETELDPDRTFEHGLELVLAGLRAGRPDV